MSNAEKRAAIAVALSTVPDVTGYERRALVTAPKVGDGWVRWGGAVREAGSAFMESWVVVIALMTVDEVTADAWIEAHMDDLFDALMPHIFIDSFVPAIDKIGGSDALALMITGRSE